MIDHPDRIPTEINDYSYLNHGPVKYIREDVVKAERNEIIEQCAMVCDARQAEHRNNYRGRISDQTKIAETRSCASAIRALKEER
jgi:hypothetical protein